MRILLAGLAVALLPASTFRSPRARLVRSEEPARARLVPGRTGRVRRSPGRRLDVGHELRRARRAPIQGV